MDIAIIILLVFLILLFRFLRMGDYFSPWFITVAVWLVIMILFQFEGDLLIPLSNQFYICLSLWIPVFVFSSIMTFYLLPSVTTDDGNPLVEDRDINIWLFRILFIISMVMTPLYVYQIFKVVTRFDPQDMFYNLRILAVYGDEGYGFLQYSYIINQALFIVSLWKYPKVPLWQLLLIVIACFIGQFAIMEKSGILFLTISTLFVLYEKQAIRLKSIIIVFVALFMLFFLINVLLTSDENDDGMTLIDFFAIYVLSPAVAFGKISPDLSHQFGSHTFQTIYLFLNRFGADFEVNQRLQDFVWVPLPTNVYTIFEPFFRDFGYKGIPFFALVYGTLFGWLYRSFCNGNMIARCVYPYFLKILIVQFYNEDFMQNIVLTIQFIFFVSIICITSIKIIIPQKARRYG